MQEIGVFFTGLIFISSLLYMKDKYIESKTRQEEPISASYQEPQPETFVDYPLGSRIKKAH